MYSSSMLCQSSSMSPGLTPSSRHLICTTFSYLYADIHCLQKPGILYGADRLTRPCSNSPRLYYRPDCGHILQHLILFLLSCLAAEDVWP